MIGHDAWFCAVHALFHRVSSSSSVQWQPWQPLTTSRYTYLIPGGRLVNKSTYHGVDFILQLNIYLINSLYLILFYFI